jgi:hypothetical protein
MLDPQQFRDEAERFRRRVECESDHEIRRQMIEIAEQCERLAELIEAEIR